MGARGGRNKIACVSEVLDRVAQLDRDDAIVNTYRWALQLRLKRIYRAKRLPQAQKGQAA